MTINTPPLLTVVIPALEADTELRRCVDSIRLACPDPRSCEIIVVLPPGRIVAARQWLPDETLIPERHASIYGAMNDGARASRSRYLYFLGKDDIVLPVFRDVLEVLESSRPNALFFDVYWGANGVYSGQPSRWRLLIRNLCHQGIIYSREAYDKHGPYLRRMKVQADHLLNIRLLWDGSRTTSILYIPRPLTWYSGAGFSTQQARDPLFWRLYPTTMRKHVGAWASWLLLAWRTVRGRSSR